MSNRRNVVILVLLATLAGCAMRGATTAPPDLFGQQQFSPQLIRESENHISPRVTGRERSVMIGAMLDAWRRTSHFPASLIMIFPQGDSDIVYANKPELRTAFERYSPVPGDSNLVMSRSGRTIVAAPKIGFEPVSSELVIPNSLGPPPIVTNQGPYRKLSTVEGLSVAEASNLSLPCNTIFPHQGNDGPYVYFSSFSSPYNNQLEAGLAYNIAGGAGTNTWSPYISVFGTHYYSTGNVLINPGQTLLYYTCPGIPSPINIQWAAYKACLEPGQPSNALYAYTFDTPPTKPCPGSPPWSTYTLFSFDVSDINDSSQNISIGVAFAGNPYHGWGGYCSTCVTGLVVALSQHTKQKDFKTFGPVGIGSSPGDSIYWIDNDYNYQINLPSSTNTPYCQDEPAWTSNQNTECRTTPANPLHKTINVSDFDYGDQTVTINNSYDY